MSQIKCVFSQDNNVLTFTHGGESFSFDRRTASAEARDYAQSHGFKQAIADCGALSAGTDGKVNPAERFAAMREKAAWLSTGQAWARTGGGGGSIGAERVRLFNALIRTYPTRSRAGLQDFVGKLAIGDVRAMLVDKDAPIVPALAAMDAETTASVNVATLWEGLPE